MSTHRLERDHAQRRIRVIRATRWPSPRETGEVYLCYPSAAAPPGDTDAWPILSCSGTLDEARSDARLFGGAAIYVSAYHVHPGGASGLDWADDERFVEVARPSENHR